jgi:eukaryotic-like serine/threonine-protein kinase
MKLPYRLGKYELLMQIGAGATGKVYLAHDTFAHREVAVKVIDQTTLADPEFNKELREQFITEVSLAGELVHPHIVSILEASISDDAGYVAMEYVPGGNLVRYTHPDNLLSISNVLQIIFKCCGALDYAYRQGIIHRDIKPENLMLVSGTEIRIADFGASIFYKTQVTQKVIVGTPSYMSLEQISGHRLTHTSDMYSLGVVAYQLLTGNLPFRAQNITGLFDAIAKNIPAPPSLFRSDIPPELDKIILRMIAKNPEDRYTNWAELALEIADIGRFSAFQQPINDSDKFTMLRDKHELSEFSDPDIWELIQASTWSRIPAHTIVLNEDEPGQKMYFLASGSLKVTKNGRLLNVIKPGEHFGEMAYIQRGSKRQASVEALADSITAELSFDALDGLSNTCQLHLAKALLYSMTDRVALAGDRIAQMRG